MYITTRDLVARSVVLAHLVCVAYLPPPPSKCITNYLLTNDMLASVGVINL